MAQGPRRPRFTSEILIRLAADLLMLNGALAVGQLLRFLLLGSQISNTDQYRAVFILAFWHCSLMFTPLGAVIFYLSGFYTRGRAYSSRYKALVIIQASMLLFVIAGLISYLLPPKYNLSRGAFLLAWMATSAALVTSRMWAKWWETVVVESGRVTVSKKNGRPRVLLIGGAGYIGSGLLPKLLDTGYEVRLLESFIYGEGPIAEYLGHPRLQIVRQDFRQVDVLVQAMKEIDTVIHLGAIVGDPACALDEELTVEVNLVATRTIAEIAKGNGIDRFVFASTCSVYGASNELLDERSALRPASLYARSKIASEQVLLNMRSPQFMPVLLRFGTIYGLSRRVRFDLVVNLLAAQALIEGEITVFGSDQWRPFLHVEDAGRAIMLAVEASSDQLATSVFNVGSDEQNLTLGELGKLINRMVPSAKLTINNRGVDSRNYRVSFRLIRERLGFVPKWTMESGVEQVIAAIRSGEVTDYHDPMYSNVKFLSEESGRPKPQNGWAERLIEKVGYTPIPERVYGHGREVSGFNQSDYRVSAASSD